VDRGHARLTNDASGAYLIIAARNEVDYTGSGRYLRAKDGGEDAFKVMQVVVDTPSVPEPGTLLLPGSGLVGLGLRWRRAHGLITGRRALKG